MLGEEGQCEGEESSVGGRGSVCLWGRGIVLGEGGEGSSGIYRDSGDEKEKMDYIRKAKIGKRITRL